MRTYISIVLVCAGLGCGGEEEAGVGANCAAMPLPFTGASADAVTILAARLECTGTAITPLITVRHPMPDELLDVQQRVGFYPDRDCAGAPTEAIDDVTSDLEESFGELILRDLNPALYDEVCGSAEWPLRVTFGTASLFPTTTGTVAATVLSN